MTWSSTTFCTAAVREDHQIWHTQELSPRELSCADVVVVITDYLTIDFGHVVDRASLAVDTWYATATAVHTQARVVSLSGTWQLAHERAV